MKLAIYEILSDFVVELPSDCLGYYQRMVDWFVTLFYKRMIC